jgi:uncharacterized membrane protein YdjX (TVP38/TMEM64 family)
VIAAAMESPETRPVLRRCLVLASCLTFAVLTGLTLSLQTVDRPVLSEAWVRDLVGDLGVFGPLALIGLMVLAIVVSPIPSGPIAVAAGALNGSFWGGSITVAGALLGALMAFGSARFLGADWVGQSQNPILLHISRPRSQFALMLIVFASRLIPFISFDLVSYGAGITCLAFGRFVLATALGVIPICFALAAMGAGMADGGANWIWIVGLGGAAILTPIIGKWIWDRTRTRR